VLGLDLHGAESLGIRILRVGMLHPLDPAALRRFATGLSEILVLEERRPFLEVHLRDALYSMADRPLIVGKDDDDGRPLVPAYGALDADALVDPVRRRIAPRVGEHRLAPVPRRNRIDVPLITRSPYFSARCPHNTGAKVPAGTSVGSGIGCHGMVGWMDEDRVGNVASLTQMGGEGAQWIGMAPFVRERHLTQNVGDGTYFHSGQLAVQAAIASGVDMTFKLLFNDAVAMTGGQDVPGGVDPVATAGILLDQGVRRVIITTEDLARYRGRRLPAHVEVWDRSRIIEAQEVLQRVAGVTVLIHHQQCAAEARRLRKRGRQPDPPRRVAIVERVCEGCGDCSRKSNCVAVPAIETEYGTKRTIDQTACNKDYSCLEGDCPSFVTFVEASPRRWARRRPARGRGRSRTQIERTDLPEPELLVTADDFTVRMPGMGGTGVVTVSQILATAAVHAGLQAGTLDQTGLAQKGGPVVSDVRIGRGPIERGAKAGAGSADLYLVFDAVVGAAPANLAAATPERTISVVSTHVAALGDQASAAGAPVVDAAPLLARIAAATRPRPRVELDAAAVAEAEFGTSTVGNVLLLGVAYQLGAIPVPAVSIEHAIELNGTAVEANVQAFRWGRKHVLDGHRDGPATDRTVLTPRAVADVGVAGAPLVERRAADLTRYQDAALAARYVSVVERVEAAARRLGWDVDRCRDAVAQELHKLMAYKDEYEVARLHLEAADADAVAALSGGRSIRMTWHLHPPVLRSMGMKRKLELRRTAVPAFKVLRALRRTRGGVLDVFGYTRIRRLERLLVDEYVAALDGALAVAGDGDEDAFVELVMLPEIVRGYEGVKLANIQRYHDELRRCGQRFGVAPRPAAVRLAAAAIG
jgi:indolepyruvate ferredoxin oxidoreductase